MEKILNYLSQKGYIDKEAGNAAENYNAEDEELIKKRLQDLGYIE
jgi:hypothetical protein